jgi:hypothetical protein
MRGEPTMGRARRAGDGPVRPSGGFMSEQQGRDAAWAEERGERQGARVVWTEERGERGDRRDEGGRRPMASRRRAGDAA